jgi:hypothetical protein
MNRAFNRFPLILVTVLTLIAKSYAQNTEQVRMSSIHSIKFHVYGDQLAYPIMKLNSSDRLELHFDDLDADVKYYSYTYILCNADWSTAPVSQFDYMKGFTNVRIGTYRNSSVVLTRYTHYTAEIPDRNTAPTRSGNYLLKVFLNGDTSKLAFTRRFLVVDPKANASASVVQPFNASFLKSHQKLQFNVNVQALRPTNIFQQIKVVILQNNRWDNAITNIQPTFNRQNILEYNTENEGLFPAQKEWRWVNLTSMRMLTDRIEKADFLSNGQHLYVKPEGERKLLQYTYYRDFNGMYQLSNIERNNPYWQADYAKVTFRFKPAQLNTYNQKKIYLFGELTGYELAPKYQLVYNDSTGFFETTQFFKQGFYDYMYLVKDDRTGFTESADTEGNWWEAENNYTILIYYRPLGGRTDELISINRVNSLANRPSMERKLL